MHSSASSIIDNLIRVNLLACSYLHIDECSLPEAIEQGKSGSGRLRSHTLLAENRPGFCTPSCGIRSVLSSLRMRRRVPDDGKSYPSDGFNCCVKKWYHFSAAIAKAATGTAEGRKSRRTFWKVVPLLEKPYHFSAGAAILWLRTAISQLATANSQIFQSFSGALIMFGRGGASRTSTFQKLSFTFTDIGASTLHKGISTLAPRN